MRSLLLFLIVAFFAAPASAQIELPDLQPTSDPIAIAADAANHWKQGAFEVWLLRGNCHITQGASSARCREAVVWIDHADALERRPSKVIAYLEGDVAVVLDPRQGGARLTDQSWLGRFYTVGAVQVHAAQVAGEPGVFPPIYQRALARLEPETPGAVRQAQLQTRQPTDAQVAPLGAAPAARAVPPAGARRLRAFPRSNVDVQAVWFPDPQSQQWIALVSSGVNLMIDGLPGFDSIDVATDRLVIWTRGLQEPDLSGQTPQDADTPLEIYMEGNIVFRQGDRVIRAHRMYYDVRNHVGTILDADVLTPVPSYQGLLRLHSDVLQQTGRDHYFARDVFITSSRMGAPTYRLQSGDIEFDDQQVPMVDPVTGEPALDRDGQPLIQHQRLATAHNNFLFVGPLPIFYWPVMSTNLTEPTYYLRRARFKQDTVFGTQILTNWNMFQLLGIRQRPEGTNWDMSLDYMSKRGLGTGTSFVYHRSDLFGIGGPAGGLVDFWGIADHGNDVLGGGRMNLLPEASYRYKLFGQHRQLLGEGFQLTAEVGLLSDRNFWQEYFQQEWDELKDPTTGIELKRIRENTSWSITLDARVNDFFTQTDWLPRADHFCLGQPLLNDTLTWYEHSSVGYAEFLKLQPPSNPADQPFSFLPWERSSQQGERFATRHEIDYPFQLGPVKFVPYALGEFAHWGADINGDPMDRLYGQAGVRASMPMWHVDPTVESGLLNVHGLAHKVVFDVEFSVAGANQEMTDLPLYDPIDDLAVEAFRRRFANLTFNSPSTIPPGTALIPFRFDERDYALRTGMGSWVTAPSTEIADDLTALRMGVHQRWQTKRGMPGNRHIIDWIVLDTNMTWFPNEGRDNFGNAFGLLDYDFRWHVGDRLTLVSSGIFDFFNQGQQLISVGGFLTRPPRGSLYLGMHLLGGPIDSQVLTASYSYWMSPKWVSTYGLVLDFKNPSAVGQNFTITRVGESLLLSGGFSVDVARNNVGANFMVEPRFYPNGQLGWFGGGARIPPAGAYGLE